MDPIPNFIRLTDILLVHDINVQQTESAGSFADIQLGSGQAPLTDRPAVY